MKELLQKLIDLARDWRDFSLMFNGWQCEHYCDEMVWCYFSDNSDHSMVRFNIKQWSFSWDTIEIAFHSTPDVSGFTARSADAIVDCIDKYLKLLDKEKEEFAKLGKAKIEKRNQVRVNKLEKQLAKAKARTGKNKWYTLLKTKSRDGKYDKDMGF